MEYPVPLHSLQSANFQCSESARHAFDYFRFKAYESFGRRGYPILWADCALTIALSEPAVFYALAASGAAEQTLTRSVHATLVRPTDRLRDDLAVDLYSKALRYLQTPMQKAIAEGGSLMPVILSCLVFVVYETTFGTHLNALRHARTGFNILNERLHRSNATATTSASDLHSSPIFALASKRPSRSDIPWFAPEELQIRLEGLDKARQEVPTSLQTLAQQFIHKSLKDLSDAQSCCITQTISRALALDTALQDRMTKTLEGFRRLSQQLRSVLLSTSNLTLQPDLLFMQIRCFHASFSLAMSRGLNEQSTDYFADDITRTLDNAERLIRLSFIGPQHSTDDKKNKGPIADAFMQKLFAAEHPPLSSGTTGTIVPLQGPLVLSDRKDRYVAGIFEFGILPALFLIACKCRASSQRRRAARLLHEANRVEAINSSHTLAVYADAVIDLEEQAAVHLTIDQTAGLLDDNVFYADEVPKQARFLDVVAAAGEHAAPDSTAPLTIVLSCTRLTEEDGSDFELLEYQYDCGNKQYDVSQLGLFSSKGYQTRGLSLRHSSMPS